MSGVQQITVGDGDDGVRLDRWFKRHYPAVKHGALEKLLRTGQVRVDGARVKSAHRVSAGEVIRIPPLGGEAAASGRPVRPEKVSEADRRFMRELVVFENDDLIALNKPPGLAVQGGTKIARHVDGLLAGLVPEGAERPKLVHRLDRETSGLLVVAKNAGAAQRLAEAFRTKETRKTYWALVRRVPEHREGEISMPIVKIEGVGPQALAEAEQRARAGEGKKALTYYRVVERAGSRIAWLALEPVTGRTHQLRIHCAVIGHPIFGDKKYGYESHGPEGRPDFAKGRNISDLGEMGETLLLHARRLELPAAALAGKKGARSEPLVIDAPLPPIMVRAWEGVGFSPYGEPEEGL